MEILNYRLIGNPLNWFIVALMVILGTFFLELILKANAGEWDCGCGNNE